MKTEIARRFQFCAGHRVPGHGKCGYLHGHNYVALVTCSADRLDKHGMVVDFGVVKRIIGGWIDVHWDHGFLFSTTDLCVASAVSRFERMVSEVFEQKIYTFVNENPTAEVMARELLGIARELLEPYSVTVVGVKLWETENCYAEVWAR